MIVAVAGAAPELVAAVDERRRRMRGQATIKVKRVAGGFVAGEETALLRALAGRAAKPTLKPPFPTTSGLRGAPTLVQNVETLAHVGLIGRFGPDWFGRGTALVTLSGAVRNPGVHEIPVGATLAEVIARCGGTKGAVSAFLVGGFFGGWVDGRPDRRGQADSRAPRRGRDRRATRKRVRGGRNRAGRAVSRSRERGSVRALRARPGGNRGRPHRAAPHQPGRTRTPWTTRRGSRRLPTPRRGRASCSQRTRGVRRRVPAPQSRP